MLDESVPIQITKVIGGDPNWRALWITYVTTAIPIRG